MDMTDGDGETEDIKYAKVSRGTQKKKKAGEWPVGRNGLRKKRVLKEREWTDEKGFLRTFSKLL